MQAAKESSASAAPPGPLGWETAPTPLTSLVLFLAPERGLWPLHRNAGTHKDLPVLATTNKGLKYQYKKSLDWLPRCSVLPAAVQG